MKKYLLTIAVSILLAGCGTVYKATVVLTDAESAVMREAASLYNDRLITPQLMNKVNVAHTKFTEACVVAKGAFAAYKNNAGTLDEAAKSLSIAKAAALPILALIADNIPAGKYNSIETAIKIATQP